MSLHGNTDPEIALFADQTTHAVTFAADDDGGRAFQIGVVKGGVTVCGSTEDPYTLLLELFEQGGDVGYAGDGHMGNGARRGLGHDGGQSGGTALGDDDTVGAGTFRCADDRTQIVGIAQLVTHHDQRRFTLFPGGGEDVLHADIFPHGSQRDHALMGVGAAHAVQLAPVGVHHHNALFPGGGSDMSQGGIRVTLHDINFVNGHAGTQRFNYRVAPFDDAVIFRLHRGGATQRSTFFHGNLPIRLVD